jgi:hypothetical protein
LLMKVAREGKALDRVGPSRRRFARLNGSSG